MYILIESKRVANDCSMSTVIGRHEDLDVLIYAAKQYMNEAKRLKRKDIGVRIETTENSEHLFELKGE